MSIKSLIVFYKEQAEIPEQPARPTPETGASDQQGRAKGRNNLTREEINLLLFEYERAQEMLAHSDSLIWQIGSILIAGTLLLTGLALSKDAMELFGKGWRSLTLVLGIPAISFLALRIWFLQARRHRSFYIFRSEVLHRIEMELGLYHFLRVAEAGEMVNIIDELRSQFWMPFRLRIPFHLRTELNIEQLFLLLLEGVKEDGQSDKGLSPRDKQSINNAIKKVGELLNVPEQYQDAAKISNYFLCEEQAKAHFSDEELSKKKELLAYIKNSKLSLLQKIIARKIEWIEKLYQAKTEAKYGMGGYKPVKMVEYSGPSGYQLSWYLAYLIPSLQFFLLFTLWCFDMYGRLPLPSARWRSMYVDLSPDIFLLVAFTLPIIICLLLLILWRNRPSR